MLQNMCHPHTADTRYAAVTRYITCVPMFYSVRCDVIIDKYPTTLSVFAYGLSLPFLWLLSNRLRVQL